MGRKGTSRRDWNRNGSGKGERGESVLGGEEGL